MNVSMTSTRPCGTRRSGRASLGAFALPAVLCGALALAGCKGDDGDTGPQGPPGGGSTATNTELSQGDALPGLNVEIVGVSGGTAAGGRFKPGDTLSVRFTVKKDDGSDWDIDELALGRALVSGPTFNYQRVIAQVTDVVTKAKKQADGSYRYTFATPIPATYLEPLNDSASFGPDDGELAGQALLNGSYTVAVYTRWSYTVDGVSKNDAGDATYDFVIGNTGTPVARAVVSQGNCNRCHVDIQAHGGSRHNVTLCLMCHTAGAEDRNTPSVLNGSPGVSIEFKTMIHKIHSGEHLPSVLGVATLPDGSRDYTATPVPYQVVGFNNSIIDFSHVAFPAWPHGLIATPRDEGYSALSSTDKAKEDLIRTGPSNCVVCHGDPDGDSGSLEAPAQGDLAFAQPTRASCGACHDDVHFGQSYTANGQTMPPVANDSNCLLCHPPSGSSGPGLLPTDAAHLHPLLDPTFNPGTVVNIEQLSEAGTNDGSGTIDPGEKIQVTFRLQDDEGNELLPSAVNNLSVVLSGPTDNYNLVLNTSLPTAALSGAQPYVLNLPMPVQLERVGTSTGSNGDVFNTAFTPIWNLSGATTTVLVRTGTPTATNLSADSELAQNFVDVNDASGFVRNDIIVVDDGSGSMEYAQIQNVIGERLWFSSPGSGSYKPALLFTHQTGASVMKVATATKTAGVDFSLDTANGTVTELVEFGNGNDVLVSYTTDFVMPSTYPGALNDSPDQDDNVGEWSGKSIVSGTYSLGLWTYQNLTLNLFGESNSYRSTAEADLFDFLVGDATDVEPYDLVSSGLNCYQCHQDVAFHGAGRRSFDACVVCHATAGGEDRPQYVAGNAPATSGVSINFRNMLHKIHMGEELANASSYTVVGFGSSAFPNNYTAHTYGEVVYPALPGGVQQCTMCHGDSNNAWKEPSVRDHPTEQNAPVQRWALVCGACHDGTDAQAHIDVQTSGTGQESCGVCHGVGKEWAVERVHKPY